MNIAHLTQQLHFLQQGYHPGSPAHKECEVLLKTLTRNVDSLTLHALCDYSKSVAKDDEVKALYRRFEEWLGWFPGQIGLLSRPYLAATVHPWRSMGGWGGFTHGIVASMKSWDSADIRDAETASVAEVYLYEPTSFTLFILAPAVTPTGVIMRLADMTHV